MARVLLAFADVGLGIQLQETLEAAGYDVRWDAAVARGPGALIGDVTDVVIIDIEALGNLAATAIDGWRGLDPAPGLVALGATPAAQAAAAASHLALLPATAPAAALGAAITEAARLRFATAMTRGLARRALGLPRSTDDAVDAASIVMAARGADVEIPRAALRWHAQDYVAAPPAAIAALRDQRALIPPEIEWSAHLDGTLTVQTLVKRGPIDAWHAARLLWALASVGAVILGPEPCDVSTARRRTLTATRFHLRARQARLDRGTFYDVLEIVPSADDAEIERGYQLAALRYAPATLAAWDLADLAAIVEPMWQQVEKARSVLFDIAARGRYNDWLASRWKELRTTWAIENTAAAAAAEAYVRGQRALAEGDIHRAMSDLAVAARNHPHHPEYESGLAWARYRVQAAAGKDRAVAARAGRTEAEAALAGTRPWPRALLALALLCAADGDPDSARWHLHEALSVDPSMPAAQQLLARLRS